MRRTFLLIAATMLLIDASGFGQKSSDHSPQSVALTLERVAAIHGAAGVFAVAGYRMGERALQELHADRGSFSLDVTHRTPLQVQYSCVADGWQAATGVSAGKLNLHIVETSPEHTETVIRNKKTGEALLFRLRNEFLAKYLNIHEDRQTAAGREVATLSDDQIFTVSVAPK